MRVECLECKGTNFTISLDDKAGLKDVTCECGTRLSRDSQEYAQVQADFSEQVSVKKRER